MYMYTTVNFIFMFALQSKSLDLFHYEMVVVDQNVQYGIFGCDGYLFFFFSNLVFLANGYSSGLANKKCVYVIKLLITGSGI